VTEGPIEEARRLRAGTAVGIGLGYETLGESMHKVRANGAANCS
jgi:uncharacterized protein YbjQ (UPF0145 family)